MRHARISVGDDDVPSEANSEGLREQGGFPYRTAGLLDQND